MNKQGCISTLPMLQVSAPAFPSHHPYLLRPNDGSSKTMKMRKV